MQELNVSLWLELFDSNIHPAACYIHFLAEHVIKIVALCLLSSARSQCSMYLIFYWFHI